MKANVLVGNNLISIGLKVSLPLSLANASIGYIHLLQQQLQIFLPQIQKLRKKAEKLHLLQNMAHRLLLNASNALLIYKFRLLLKDDGLNL
jgi:hypothetical protein